MNFTLNQLERQVETLSEKTGKFPSDIREQLMRQYDLTSGDWARLNPALIRSTLPGGGFMGQPG